MAASKKPKTAAFGKGMKGAPRAKKSAAAEAMARQAAGAPAPAPKKAARPGRRAR